VVDILEHTLEAFYQRLDEKDALINRLLARLRELGQGGLRDDVVPN